MQQAPPQLKKTLGPLSLWGLGVGYVISGEYFGWNLGLPLAGSLGMLLATLLVTLMYAGFALGYAELACALPRAGGAFVYTTRAYGRRVGSIAGVAQLIEFTLAPPAIALAIAAYVTQRYPALDTRGVALATYVVFSALNAWGVRQAARFELFVTVLAVLELLLFACVALPHFELAAFRRDALPHGIGGAFAALPFAIWFYLGIEGVANAAEESENPQRDVAFGFVAALGTLVALALLVFFSAVGVSGWHAVVYPPGSSEPSDAPLPLALAQVVSSSSALYSLLLGIGMLGLIASFHGILLASARTTMELGRAGFAPSILGRVHARSGTPRVALLVNMLLGALAILSGRTADIITLSVLGALLMYVLALSSLFHLRRTEPRLKRPFLTPLYPFLPALSLAVA
ncbi:MAG: ethanolamine:proton symporter, family, partial [Myxococcaceae bacterium]|nr:ethanolamine:proton symporter, family [Myxococcaceae bacterium]